MPIERRLSRIAPIILVLLFIAAPADAETLYETGFEAPTFTVGPLNGQDGFVALFGVSPNAAMISTTAPRTGSQSVEVRGGALEDLGGEFFYGEYSRGIDFVAAPGRSIVEIIADVRLDGPATPLDVLSVNLGAFTPEGDTLGDFSISSTSSINGRTDPDPSAPVLSTAGALGAYISLRMTIDFQARTTAFFVGGASLGVLSIPTAITSNSLGFVSLVMISEAPANATAGYTGFFDNLRVQAVIPEPRSLVLMGLGGLGLGLGGLARGRRRG